MANFVMKTGSVVEMRLLSNLSSPLVVNRVLTVSWLLKQIC